MKPMVRPERSDHAGALGSDQVQNFGKPIPAAPAYMQSPRHAKAQRRATNQVISVRVSPGDAEKPQPGGHASRRSAVRDGGHPVLMPGRNGAPKRTPQGFGVGASPSGRGGTTTIDDVPPTPADARPAPTCCIRLRCLRRQQPRLAPRTNRRSLLTPLDPAPFARSPVRPSGSCRSPADASRIRSSMDRQTASLGLPPSRPDRPAARRRIG